jgi:hypothetical protein
MKRFDRGGKGILTDENWKDFLKANNVVSVSEIEAEVIF